MADSKLVSHPSDEINAITIKYLNHEIGAVGAGGQIMKILTRIGYTRKEHIHPMRVCFNRLNRDGVIRSSQEVEPLME